MGLVQLNYKTNNFRSKKNMDYSHVQILVIISTHTRQLTSPFSISQLPQNMDECSFKYFIKHFVAMRKNSNFKHKKLG